MKKKNVSNVILILVFLVGLSLLLYPTISDYWNTYHQTRAITDYAQNVAGLDDEQYDEFRRKAEEFNRELLERSNDFYLSSKQREQYEELLNVSGNGVMGFVEIPSIDCSLPVYHGTKDSVLQIAVGHLEWSSLPVGGSDTHSVISGHRGLPSAKLFTDLDKIVVGDIFMLNVLDDVLTYEVDQILIVEPDELDALVIEEGQDYCTLMTCTPYGINSHRLLVRGHRVDNQMSETYRVTADARQIDPVIVAPVIAVPILVGLLIILLAGSARR